MPFPKQIELKQGTFPLEGKLVLEAPAEAAELIGGLIAEELKRAGLAEPELRKVGPDACFVRLSAQGGAEPPKVAMRGGATPEVYALHVGPNEVVCAAPAAPGLFYAVQTLRQLIRANRRDGALPNLWDTCAAIDCDSPRFTVRQKPVSIGISREIMFLQQLCSFFGIVLPPSYSKQIYCFVKVFGRIIAKF